MATETIQAIHDDELDEFLKSLGLLSDFNARRLRCWFCDDVIDSSNLETIFPVSGTIKLACCKPTCVKDLHEYRYSRAM